MAGRAVGETVTLAGRAERARVARASVQGVLGPGHPCGDVATLLVGDTPDSLNVRERLAAAVARQLSAAHRIPEKLYLEAEKAFGAKGLFDIAALMGQYQTVCTLLTLFDVPAPN